MVYEEHWYYEEDGSPGGVRTVQASYAKYPEQFPNQGDYEQKSLFTFEAEGGITYGHAAMEVGIKGINVKGGFNLQAGNYLIGGVFNSEHGFESRLLETDELEIRAEASVGQLGVGYSNTVQPRDGQFGEGNVTISGGSPFFNNRGTNLSIANASASSFFIGPEVNFAVGLGVRLRLGGRINYPKSFTSFEKREIEALNNN